ncbi:hypothetical protein LPN04_29625 [Rugamonas sp. A1-17]|nr:hypothetical protein [Rugamonas sp. A1-17]
MSFKPAVENLFTCLHDLTGVGGESSPAFIRQLKGDALLNRRDWQLRLDSYMQCLRDQDMLNGEQMARLLELASKCPEPAPSTWTALSPIGWLLLGAFSVLGWEKLALSWIQIGCFFSAAAVLGGYLGWTMYRRPQSQPRLAWNRWHRLFLVAIGAVIASVMSVFVPGIAEEGFMKYVAAKHKSSIDKFAQSPEGMPMISKFAKESFGIDVVLAEPKDSWKTTTLMLGESSPASMEVRQGYCELYVDSWTVERDFGPKSAQDRGLWTNAVLMHELAHCADVARDLPKAGSGGPIDTHSIAPADSAGIRDIPSYIAASRRPLTQLWREAYADIMAIGYLKVTAPNSAQRLTSDLREKRLSNKTDKIHATMCWIDRASGTFAPSSLADLPRWSDEVRRGAGCKG